MIPMMVAYRIALFLLALAEWPQTAAAELPAGSPSLDAFLSSGRLAWTPYAVVLDVAGRESTMIAFGEARASSGWPTCESRLWGRRCARQAGCCFGTIRSIWISLREAPAN
jgi:hypothetical protein